MSDALTFVILSLAVWRVTRIIVVEDGPFDVFVKLRARLGAHKQETWVQRGLTCMACISFWLGIIPTLMYFGVSVEAVIYGLALSAASVVLMRRVG